MNPYYKDYSEYLAGLFPGVKVQKLSINAGFTCPNRDGTISRGGCIYCDNRSFTPRYCDPADGISTQLAKGKAFFRKKYPSMRYLAYFQSFTATHCSAPEVLERMYEEVLTDDDMIGIIIGTRPDCLPDNILKILERLNERCKVIVEIGAETSFDSTLRLVNRCHTWMDVEESVRRLAGRGLEVGLHLIAGLPGEDPDMTIFTTERACALPVSTLKFHQLQVIRDTPLDIMRREGSLPVITFTLEDYLDLCVRIVRTVNECGGTDPNGRPRIAIERFLASSPPEMLAAPGWGLKNFEFTNLLLNRLRRG